MAYPNPYVPNYNLRTPASMDARLTQIPTSQQMLDRNMPQAPTTANPVNWGGVAQAGIGALGIAAGAVNMGAQRLDIDESAPGIETSATGQPVYNSSFYLQAKNARPQRTSLGEVLGMGGQGASAGLGLALATNIAAGPLALAGLAVGAGAALIGGNARRRAMERQKRRAMSSAKAQQKSFNAASEAFDEQQASQQDYIRRRNMTNRLYNLYQV